MTALEAIAAIVGTAAWPACVLACFFIVRSNMKGRRP